LWNGPASNLLEKAGRLGIAFPFYRTLFFLGHRFARFEARFRLRSGVVSEYTYKLQLDDGSFSTPGLLTLDVQGGGDNELRCLSDSFDENPEYQEHSFHKWPDKDLGLRFFPGAAAEQQSHAFQLQLSCMQRSQGCRFAREILPAAYEDMEQISFAARRRLDSRTPCPDRILAARVKHFPKLDIRLAEVTQANGTIRLWSPRDSEPYRTARLQEIKILRGKKEDASATVEEPMWIHRGPTREFANPAAGLLKPGAQFLIFSGREVRLESACTMVSATPYALQILQRALVANDR